MTMDYTDQLNQGLNSGTLDPGQAMQQLTNYLQQSSGGMQSGATAQQSQWPAPGQAQQPMQGGSGNWMVESPNRFQNMESMFQQNPMQFGGGQQQMFGSPMQMLGGGQMPGGLNQGGQHDFMLSSLLNGGSLSMNQGNPLLSLLQGAGLQGQAIQNFGPHGGYSYQFDSPGGARDFLQSLITPGYQFQQPSGNFGGGDDPMGRTFRIPGAGGYASGGGLQNGPNNQWFGMPGTFSLPGSQGIQGGGGMGGGQPFGFQPGQGVPGGNARDFLAQLGLPVPGSVDRLMQGQGVGSPGNLSSAMQQLGGFGMPSPQALGNMSGSEQEFFAGLMETLLGIPFGDVVGEGRRPFRGLRSARTARRR